MRECSTCKMRKYCKQAYRIRRTTDANGRPYQLDTDVTLYDYVARAYNHANKEYEEYRGTIRVKDTTRFTAAISANIRGRHEHSWFCISAKQL